jgi:hypothetical protein
VHHTVSASKQKSNVRELPSEFTANQQREAKNGAQVVAIFYDNSTVQSVTSLLSSADQRLPVADLCIHENDH